MEVEELIKTAASPHLVASATKANELLSRINALVSDLRQEVAELRLQAELHENLIMKQEGKTIPLKQSEFKISDIYRNWKKKEGQLSDLRAIRRNLERHANLLFEQEKYSRKNYSPPTYSI